MTIGSGEQFAEANGITICYETFGDSTNPPLLLVSGLGVQMIGWAADLCAKFVERGFFVIRYDNRDVGRSTRFEGLPVPRPHQILMRSIFGRKFRTSYTLSDMACDGVGLLDALNIRAAHLFGVSMGGMIAQTIAIEHPHRVLSLTSMMSTTGERNIPRPTNAAMRVLLTSPPRDRDGYIEASLATYKTLSGSKYPLNEARLRPYFSDVHKRGRYPAGVGRQLGAIINNDGRRSALQHVHVPALVIHGDEDPLVRYEGGKDTADALPNAKLMTIHGLGHTLPMVIWDQIVDGIATVAGM